MAVKAEFQADFKSFNDGVDKADQKLKAFGDTARKTATSSNQFATAIGQVDSVLSAAGVNLGPTAKALDEMASAAGKSAADLGALATAGLVVGTAMAAWDFGRAIAGFFELDKAIGDNVATMLGWGDVASEVAGAKQDTINAAIRNGAAATISYSDAIKYNTEFHKKRLDTVKDVEKADKAVADAWTELGSIGADYTATLNAMNPAHVEQIKHYLEMGVAQGTLATAFGVTVSQVKAVAESMERAAAIDKAWLEQMKASAAEADLYASVLQNFLKKAYDDTAAANVKATAALTAETDKRIASILAEQTARDIVAAKFGPQVDATTTAWMTMQASLAALSKEQVGNIDTTARQQVIWDTYIATIDQANQAQAQAPAALDATAAATQRATQAAGVYMNQLQQIVNDPKIAGFFGLDAKGAVANTLYGGGQGGITPQMAAAMAAGQFINTAGVGAVHNTFNISQPLGTPDAIASAVSGAMTPQIMRGAKLG